MSTRKIKPSKKKLKISDKIFSVFPIFWKKCRICRQEKHFEWMKRYDNYYCSNSVTGYGCWDKYYFCRECSPTKTEAIEWIKKWMD